MDPAAVIGRQWQALVWHPDHRGSFNSFYDATHDDMACWGIASICSSVLLLAAYGVFPSVRRTPGWQFLYSSLCEIYVAAGFVFISLLDRHDVAHLDVERLICAEYRTQLLSVLAMEMAANCWRLFMFVDLIVVYHNPFWPETTRPLYHVIVVAAALVWALALSNTGVLCGTSDEDGGGGPRGYINSVNLSTLTWGLIYLPFLMFVLLGGSLYVAVRTLLSRDKWTAGTFPTAATSQDCGAVLRRGLTCDGGHFPDRSTNQIKSLARQRVMQHCWFYLMLYGTLLGVLAAGYANYQLFGREVAKPQP